MWARIMILACLWAGAGKAMADGKEFASTFDTADGWHVAQYDFDHPAFDTDWRREQVVFDRGLTLSLAPHRAGVNRFVSGSIRRKAPTGFGLYEAQFQAASGDGLVTGFFTYTGPAYGTQHDEIDVEILGKDPTRVQIGWFTDGVHQARMLELGFDASKCIHTYSIEWQPNRIDWYVNGQLIATSGFAETPPPQTPSLAFANLWAADDAATDWAGRPEPESRATAHFKTLSYRPTGAQDGLVIAAR